MAKKKREYAPDVGSIEAPRYPALEEYFVDPVQKLSRNPVGQFVAPTALAEYLHKLNYGDRTSLKDKGLAALDAALLDKPAALGLGALAKGAGALKGLSAALPFLHASPHKFGEAWNRFTLSKLGSGEGAQAFGWGAYGTNSPTVRDEYYKQFLKKSRTLRPDEPPTAYRYRGEYVWPDPAKETATPLKRSDLLHRDKPLKAQPKVFDRIIEGAMNAPEGSILRTLLEERLINPDMTGAALYNAMEHIAKRAEPDRMKALLSKSPEYARDVSLELSSLGIPGLVYKANTRQSTTLALSQYPKKPSRAENYVMFNDSGVNMLRRDRSKLNEPTKKPE